MLFGIRVPTEDYVQKLLELFCVCMVVITLIYRWIHFLYFFLLVDLIFEYVEYLQCSKVETIKKIYNS